MDTEIGVLDYLKKYGNTSETDLFDYMVQVFGLPRKDAGTLLNMMINEGSVKRVLHDKLVSKPVYVAQGNNVALDMALKVGVIALDIKNKDEIAKDGKEIMEEVEFKANYSAKIK